jgi:molybdopterin biosynthesis enzyme
MLGMDNVNAPSKAIHTNAPISYSTAVSILQEIAKETSGRFAQDEELMSMVDAVRRICKKDYISSHSTPKFDTSAQGNKE